MDIFICGSEIEGWKDWGCGAIHHNPDEWLCKKCREVE
jgi:hypothetical protein